MTDWADEGWNEFEAEHLANEEPTKAALLLLKEAWLHGARTAMDKTIAVVRDNAPSPALTADDKDDPTPWCSGCGSMTKAGCDCGPLAENE
jgi:hypothetical protein